MKWWLCGLGVLGLFYFITSAGPSETEQMRVDIERFRLAKAELETCVAQGRACTDGDRARLGRELAQAEWRYNRWMGTVRH